MAAGVKGSLVYVVNAPGFFVSHRLPLALAARAAGWAVRVITPDGPGVEAIRAAGLDWTAMPLDRGGLNPARDARSLWFLYRAYRRWRPDVVHHVTVKPVLYGSIAARLAGVPRIVNAVSGMGYLFTGGRGWLRRLGTVLYRAALGGRRMTVILQNEEDMALFRAARLAPPDTLVLIPGSGVDTGTFAPPPGRPSGPPVVLQSCRMLADKGVREFIAAARALRPRYPEARFVLAGAPDPGNPSSLSEAELRTAADEGVIEWWGHRTDMPAVLAQATIYCLASYREGLPKSLIEAAATGLPLIATDTSGCREVVRPGETGLLVPVADAAALATAIAALLGDPARRARMGSEARADAVARFALDRIVARQIALYETV